jgi:hypothetical protein
MIPTVIISTSLFYQFSSYCPVVRCPEEKSWRNDWPDEVLVGVAVVVEVHLLLSYLPCTGKHHHLNSSLSLAMTTDLHNNTYI